MSLQRIETRIMSTNDTTEHISQTVDRIRDLIDFQHNWRCPYAFPHIMCDPRTQGAIFQEPETLPLTSDSRNITQPPPAQAPSNKVLGPSPKKPNALMSPSSHIRTRSHANLTATVSSGPNNSPGEYINLLLV